MLPLAVLALSTQSVVALADAEFERKVEERLAALEDQKGGQKSSSALSDNVQISGLIEVEAAVGDSDEFSDQSYSSLAVATVELGLAAKINEQVSAEIVLLYEQGDTPLDVDVATINIDQLLGPVNLLIGKQYVPFGRFETALVNDTLVLELAETNKTSALFGFEQDGLTAGLYLFDGDVDREDHVENWGLTFTFGQDNWAFGTDYLSSFAETDGMADSIPDGFEYKSDDGAFTLFGKLDLEGVTIIGEYLTAVDDVNYTNGVVEGSIEPKAIQVEVDIAADIGGKEYDFGFAVQQTDDAAGALPEQRLSLGGSTEVYDGVGLGVEYWYDVDYDTDDDGTDEKANNIVLQLAVEF